MSNEIAKRKMFEMLYIYLIGSIPKRPSIYGFWMPLWYLQTFHIR